MSIKLLQLIRLARFFKRGVNQCFIFFLYVDLRCVKSYAIFAVYNLNACIYLSTRPQKFFRFLQSKMYLLFICLALEPRTLTRWDVHKYARRAYDMGVRYIGGCCGFEPYHIRAIAEEVGLMNK